MRTIAPYSETIEKDRMNGNPKYPSTAVVVCFDYASVLVAECLDVFHEVFGIVVAVVVHVRSPFHLLGLP